LGIDWHSEVCPLAVPENTQSTNRAISLIFNSSARDEPELTVHHPAALWGFIWQAAFLLAKALPDYPCILVNHPVGKNDEDRDSHDQ
jgi:hypothetical protein